MQGTGEDYLTEWYDHMRLIRFQNNYQQNKYFVNLDQIYQELASFFDRENFSVKRMINPDNWFLHILANKQLPSLCIMNELAELIRYYKTVSNAGIYRMRNNVGHLNYRELKEKFYEIYVRYLLNSVNLETKIGEHYLSSKGIKKEIDLLLAIDGQQYNIEVTKYYDGYKDSLVDLGQSVVEIIRKTGDKKRIEPHEMFSGYFAFKNRNAKSITANKGIFESKMQDFFNGFRNGNGVITLPQRVSNDEFEFDLESSYSNNYKAYPVLLSKFNAYVSFATTWQLGDAHYNLDTDIQISDEIKKANERLIDKIKKKLIQHKESPYRLLIVVGIEEIFSTHEKGRAIPIRKENIDTEAIHKLLKFKALLWLIFKEYNPKGVVYQSMILGNGVKDAVMIEKLYSINQEVLYKADK